METTLTNKTFTTLARAIRYDGSNEWGGTESSSPNKLIFGTSKNSTVTENLFGTSPDALKKQLYSWHKSVARTFAKEGYGDVVPDDYKAPAIEKFNVAEVPLNQIIGQKTEGNVVELLQAIAKNYPDKCKEVFGEQIKLPEPSQSQTPWTEVSNAAQSITFFSEVHELFSMGESKVFNVNGEGDPYDTTVLVLKTQDGVAYGRTLLVRT
ncbi:MAG TPA: hypothetical protein VK203_19700 [Nostocaceae cyanobacterium]|nr:hypothetical protein [Nostocaceae cyanobacterium]